MASSGVSDPEAPLFLWKTLYIIEHGTGGFPVTPHETVGGCHFQPGFGKP